MRFSPRRLSVRAKLLIGFAPLALLLLIFAGKVLLMVSANETGRDAYAQQGYETAEAQFHRNRHLDLLEDWVASYNRGTTLIQLNRYEQARTDLERALTRVPADRDCMVRINLVLAIEGQGDELLAQQHPADAERVYAEAREVLRKGQCGDLAASPSGSSKPSSGRSGPSTKNQSGQPTTGKSGQPTTGNSGEPTTGKSGDPTGKSQQPSPTSPEQRREQEQQQAQEADQRLNDKQQEAQRRAEQQRVEESHRATASPSSSNPPSSADPQQQQDQLNNRNEKGQQRDQQGKDREDRSNAPTATGKKTW